MGLFVLELMQVGSGRGGGGWKRRVMGVEE